MAQTAPGQAVPGQMAPGLSATDPSATAEPSFGVVQPGFLTYYQQHGGLRVLGLPLSHDFQLLGRRVQIFERQALQQRPDGSVRPLDILGEPLPLVHADGATFPDADPDMLAAIPALDSPGYQDQALAAIDGGLLDATAPDTWNDLPVNFGATFRATVTCADLPSTLACDDRRLLRAALDTWGLPTSAPAAEPGNPDLIYLRFQRGIMQFSQASGQTQAVPLGTWFKRVLIGTDVPDDLATDMLGSRYYAQYAPSLPLGVARPSELPATSLAAAFSASSTFSAAGFPDAPDAGSTPVLGPALPSFGTTGGQPPLASASPVASMPPGGVSGMPPSGTPGVAPSLPGASVPTGTTVANGAAATISPATTSGAPQGPDPCAGDEQILFAPMKPYVGTDVLVAVTSAKHHDVRTVRLTGPVKPGPVSERPGLNGWVWEWTISPAIEGWYEFTFFVDGARACATSGFNALPAFGATPTPTTQPTANASAGFSSPTAFATATPTPTSTVSPTATLVPAPLLGSPPADPACGAAPGQLLRLNGSNFGASQAALNGTVLFSPAAGSSSTASAPATIYSWTTTSILLTVPSSLPTGSYEIVVITSAGPSTPVSYKVGGPCV